MLYKSSLLMLNDMFFFFSIKIVPDVVCLTSKNIKTCQPKVLTALNSSVLIGVCFSSSLTIMMISTDTTQTLLSTNWTIQLEGLSSIRL